MQKNEKPPTRGRGRPSKLPAIDLNEVERLYSLGITDEEMSFVLGIGLSTLEAWKKKPKFQKALKGGKAKADAKVIDSLFKRACGYDYVEESVETEVGALVKTRKTTKHVVPDTTACIFWLKNRRRLQWRDSYEMPLTNPEDEDGKKEPVLLKIVHTKG